MRMRNAAYLLLEITSLVVGGLTFVGVLAVIPSASAGAAFCALAGVYELKRQAP